jgi:hypothetical protein
MFKFHGSCLATVYSPVVVAVVVDRPVAVKHQPILTGLQGLGPYKQKIILQQQLLKKIVEQSDHVKRKNSPWILKVWWPYATLFVYFYFSVTIHTFIQSFTHNIR